MSQNLILIPVLLQILLTLSVYFAMTRAKARAIANGEVDQARRSLHDDAWPDYVQKINNNLRNQFESPVLFYVLTLIIWELQRVDVITVALASLYVLSRAVHAFVHTGSNYVPLRKRVFMFSILLLIILAVQVTLAVFRTL